MLALITPLFDGVAYGMLLFTISVGLSVTMGIMHFTNLAHGSFAMGGAYLLVVLVTKLGMPFIVSVALVFILVFLVGLAAERFIFRYYYKSTPLEQVLLTIGIVFMSVAITRYLFGPLSVGFPLPSYLSGSLQFGEMFFPLYRIAIIIFGLCIAVILWLVLDRTLTGAKLRAAVERRSIAEAVGINVSLLLSVVFALGAGLAALGGALSVEILGLTPTYALDYLALVLIIVIVGGMGSVKGAFFTSLLIGIVDNGGKFLFPELGAFIVYFIAFAVLLWRPDGLFARLGRI